MKRIFILSLGAALLMMSCAKTNDVYVGAPEGREIAFSAVASPATRAAVDGTAFTPTSMEVAAWDVTNNRGFFAATTFTKGENQSTWKGGKYWPLSPATINFLAYAELNAGSATWASEQASGVVLVMADNATNQKDLMYAIGTGTVSQSGNGLTFPENGVTMTFKHAQAWVSFYANAYDATTGGKVTLNSITLNGAKYNGTFTVTHTNYNAASQQSVDGAWSSLGAAKNVAVPGWTAAAVAYAANGNGAAVGNGLMVVPDNNSDSDDFTGFTINYSIDGKAYDYTYTPNSGNLDQAKHYIYNIVFRLHEIEVAAGVADWTDQDGVSVPIF